MCPAAVRSPAIEMLDCREALLREMLKHTVNAEYAGLSETLFYVADLTGLGGS